MAGSTLRVLLSFPTRIGTPGIGTTAWYQAAGLARRGVQVHVACGSVERELPGVVVERETMRVRGQKVPYRLVGSDRALAYHDRCVAKLLSRTRAFDVVHAWPSGAERTLQAARNAGIPAFLERPSAHTAFHLDVVQRECERLGLNLKRSSLFAFDPVKLAREERDFAAADALLCPSDFVAATHADRGEPASRLLRHRYGYDPERFLPPSSRSLPDAPLVFTFLGRLEPGKGVHLALEAWRQSAAGQSARLLLCGPMEPGYERVLAPLLEQPGVELVGPIANPAGILQQTDALLLPSLGEGSALVTYEARGSGAVLLVSDRSGAVARNGHDALIHPAGEQAALANHLRLLCRDRRLLERLRANSLAGIGALTWDAAAGALLDAYADGCDRVRRRRRSVSTRARQPAAML